MSIYYCSPTLPRTRRCQPITHEQRAPPVPTYQPCRTRTVVVPLVDMSIHTHQSRWEFDDVRPHSIRWPDVAPCPRFSHTALPCFQLWHKPNHHVTRGPSPWAQGTIEQQARPASFPHPRITDTWGIKTGGVNTWGYECSDASREFMQSSSFTLVSSAHIRRRRARDVASPPAATSRGSTF
jgi:hypothetical protein